jgi:CubicO group peptidase (beta-lactamase class C family)
MQKHIFTFVVLLFSKALMAQTDSLKLDSLMTQLDKHQKAMVSVALSEKGQFIYQRTIGYADIEKKQGANVYTQYRIGSISKMFTAVMILQLIDEKKLALNTTLNTFYHSLPNASKITIEQLLSHRTGLENFTSNENYLSFHTQPKTEQELISMFEKGKTEFEPDAMHSYSNTNYVLLSFILEKITKKSYADLLRMRICAKANLGDTYVGGQINAEKNEALSYEYENNTWVKSAETDMSIPRGAGNIVSTTHDLSRFIETLFDGKFITQQSLTKMLDLKDGYGLGIIRMPFDKSWWYGHTGGIDGFQSMLAYNQEKKATICILGNGYNYPMNTIAIALLSAYYGKPFEIPSFKQQSIPLEQLKGLAGIYNNEKIGMKITMKEDSGTLSAQATGQAAFPLEKVSELSYKFEAAKVEITFIKDADGGIRSFNLKQGGMDLIFNRE